MMKALMAMGMMATVLVACTPQQASDTVAALCEVGNIAMPFVKSAGVKVTRANTALKQYCGPGALNAPNAAAELAAVLAPILPQVASNPMAMTAVRSTKAWREFPQFRKAFELGEWNGLAR